MVGGKYCCRLLVFPDIVQGGMGGICLIGSLVCHIPFLDARRFLGANAKRGGYGSFQTYIPALWVHDAVGDCLWHLSGCADRA